MTGPTEDDAHKGSEDLQGRALADTERPRRAQTLKSVHENPTDPSHMPSVTIQAKDFRLPEVLAHLAAGRAVIVVPTPQPPD